VVPANPCPPGKMAPLKQGDIYREGTLVMNSFMYVASSQIYTVCIVCIVCVCVCVYVPAVEVAVAAAEQCVKPRTSEAGEVLESRGGKSVTRRRTQPHSSDEPSQHETSRCRRPQAGYRDLFCFFAAAVYVLSR